MEKYTVFVLLFFLISVTAHSQVAQNFKIDVSVDKGDESTYYADESIFISFRSEEDAYIVVYDIDTDGEISLILPEDAEDKISIKANKTYQIPEDGDFSFKVRGPEGEEFICMVASRKPLKLPDILGIEGEKYSIKGDREKAIKKINEEILSGNKDNYSTDVCHFYVEEDAEHVPAPLFRHPVLPGSVEILSRPGGAKIYLDGMYFGRTPAVIGGIPPGKHKIKLTKKGYFKIGREFFIESGERENIKVNMKWKLW